MNRIEVLDETAQAFSIRCTKNSGDSLVSFNLLIHEDLFGKIIKINNEDYVIAQITEKSVLLKLSDYEIVVANEEITNQIERYEHKIHPGEYFHIPHTNKICINPLVYEENPVFSYPITYGIRLFMFLSTFSTNKEPSVDMFKNVILVIDSEKYAFKPGEEFEGDIYWSIEGITSEEISSMME